MTFIQYNGRIGGRIDRPIGLQRNHVDVPTLTLTFHYREWVDSGQQWEWQSRQQVLELHTHYRIDKRRGTIVLVDHPFWNQLGRWGAGDRIEPLLYKGQVKHERGQRIEFLYEHYEPEQVDDPSAVDLQEVDAVASARLGYDVLRYSPIAKDKPAPADSWDWEKKPAVVEP